jgi:hypothetical protein
MPPRLRIQRLRSERSGTFQSWSFSAGLAGCLAAAAGSLPFPATGELPAEPPAAAAVPAADGTTSVVVPGGEPPPPVSQVPAGQQPVSQVPASQPSGVATALLVECLEPLPGAEAASLYARPLSLLEAIERSGDRTRRLWIVQAYWKVSVAHASVRTATTALERLELVAPGGDPHDRGVLDVATAAARADLADAQARLAIAQQELVDLSRLPLGEPLPWPIDRPLAAAYETHFDAIFATRIATGRVRAIARTLPVRHEAIEARATAVRAAEAALARAEADHAKAARPIEAVIAAHATLVSQEREFLEATRAYNLEIGEYAMAVADLSVPDDAFVSMLIGTPIQWRQQAPAPQPD